MNPYIDAHPGMSARQGVVFRLLLDAQALRSAMEEAVASGMPADLVLDTVEEVLIAE